MTSNKKKSTAWNLTPKIGFFIIDSFVVGFNLNLRGESWKIRNDMENMPVTTIRPSVRYNGSQSAFVNSKLVLITETKFLYGISKYRYSLESTSNTSKDGIIEFAVGPSVVFLIFDCLKLNMMVLYRCVSIKQGANFYNDKFKNIKYGDT